MLTMLKQYQRCLIKVSGESLADKKQGQQYDQKKLVSIAHQLIRLADEGYEIAVVVGGGNIWRGKNSVALGMDKTTGDYMGMLATIMNALALESTIRNQHFAKVIVCNSLEVNKISEPYYFKKAIKRLEEGYIVILAAGTGSPYFTTDTAATLRAIELKADLVLMAKNGVNGVYSADPKLDASATKFDTISLSKLYELNLGVMDNTAAALAMDAKLDMIVFNIDVEDNIYNALKGKADITMITGE